MPPQQQVSALRDLLRSIDDAIAARQRAADALAEAQRLQQDGDMAVAAVLLDLTAAIDAWLGV